MKARRVLGGTLSATGVVLATLFAAPEPARWAGFAVSLVVLVVGLLLLRAGRQSDGGALQNTLVGAQPWQRLLRSAEATLQKLVLGRPGTQTADEIARVRLDVYVPFADAGESFATVLGLHRYADVMIAFARSERALNRAQSAFVDGYPSEGVAALRESLQYLRQTMELLEAVPEQAVQRP